MPRGDVVLFVAVIQAVVVRVVGSLVVVHVDRWQLFHRIEMVSKKFRDSFEIVSKKF